MDVLDEFKKVADSQIEKTKAECVALADKALKQGFGEIHSRIMRAIGTKNEDDRLILNLSKPLSQNLADSKEALAGFQYDPELVYEVGLGRQVTPNDIYQYITDMVLELIDSKEPLPWRKPWDNNIVGGHIATNFISRKPYRGVNHILLNIIYPAIRKKAWESPFFLTVNQIEELGGKMKEGSKAARVTYFNFLHFVAGKKISQGTYVKYLERIKTNPDFTIRVKGESVKVAENIYRIPFLKYYNVFNAGDVSGIEFPKVKSTEIVSRNPDQKQKASEMIVEMMPNRPKLLTGTEAFYRPSEDSVTMPAFDSFDGAPEYYSTLFHELIHSTKAKNRLNDPTRGGKRFGDKQYAIEELVAELGAVYLTAETGMLFHTKYNSAAYLKGWKKRFQDNNKIFYNSASKAQLAADYILDRSASGEPAYLSKFLQSRGAKKRKPHETKKLPGHTYRSVKALMRKSKLTGAQLKVLQTVHGWLKSKTAKNKMRLELHGYYEKRGKLKDPRLLANLTRRISRIGEQQKMVLNGKK